MLTNTDNDHTMPFDLSVQKLRTNMPMHLFIETQLCIDEFTLGFYQSMTINPNTSQLVDRASIPSSRFIVNPRSIFIVGHHYEIGVISEPNHSRGDRMNRLAIHDKINAAGP